MAKKLTVDDFLALPDGPPWVQLIDGAFYVSESPSKAHQQVVGKLHLALGNWIERTRLGEVYLAPFDVILSRHDVAQPDLLFVSLERADRVDAKGVKGAPDMAIEILSPTTAALDQGKKLALYARSGVRELWLIDPTLRTVTIRRFGPGLHKSEQSCGPADRLQSPLLPGFAIPAARIFP